MRRRRGAEENKEHSLWSGETVSGRRPAEAEKLLRVYSGQDLFDLGGKPWPEKNDRRKTGVRHGNNESAVPGISFAWRAVAAETVTVCGLYQWAYGCGRKRFWYIVALTVAVGVAGAVLARDVLWWQLRYMADCVSGSPAEEIPVTGLMMAVVLYGSAGLFVCEYVWGHHLVPYWLTTAFFMQSRDEVEPLVMMLWHTGGQL